MYEYIETEIQYINDSQKCTQWKETKTFKTVEEAKTWCKDEFGKHKRTNMYIDRRIGEPLHCGYVYSRRQRYDDINKTYFQSIWISFETVKRETANLAN